MKKSKSLILLSVVLLLFSIFSWGCKRSVKAPEEILEHLKSIKSYSANIDINIKNDRQNLKYECKEFYDKNLGYRLEIGNDRVQIYRDNKIFVSDKRNGAKYALDPDFDQIYSLSFIGKYIDLLYTNEEIKYSSKLIDGKKYQIIELLLPGNNRNLFKAEMYISIKTYLPEKIIVYDNKENERILIEYIGFAVNESLNNELFKVDQQ